MDQEDNLQTKRQSESAIISKIATKRLKSALIKTIADELRVRINIKNVI